MLALLNGLLRGEEVGPEDVLEARDCLLYADKTIANANFESKVGGAAVVPIPGGGQGWVGDLGLASRISGPWLDR